MGKFIEYTDKIMIPVQIVEMKFCEKEDTSLNPFQKFILEAIEQGNSFNQIVEATLLTQNVVETEIIQMIGQKLLVKEEEIVLSELSKNILMISRCVKKLNDEHRKVCINLMTGDIEAYNKDNIIVSKKESIITLMPKISERDIDGISIEENTSFFRTYMSSFMEMTEDQIDTVLSAVYIEFESSKMKSAYKEHPIIRVPCMICENSISPKFSRSEEDDKIFSRGRWYKLMYSVKSDIVNSRQSILQDLINISESDSELLTNKALDIVRLYKECLLCNQKKMVCYYDAVSGFFQFDEPQHIRNKRTRISLELPSLNKMDKSINMFLLEKAREYFDISHELSIEEVECKSEDYVVECSLTDLWSEYYD